MTLPAERLAEIRAAAEAGVDPTPEDVLAVVAEVERLSGALDLVAVLNDWSNVQEVVRLARDGADVRVWPPSDPRSKR